MAEEAIQAVRQAETAAAALVREAVARQDAMLLKAKQDAERNKNDTITQAASRETAALEKIRSESESVLQEAVRQADAEIIKLKELAAARQKEAIELVINALA